MFIDKNFNFDQYHDRRVLSRKVEEGGVMNAFGLGEVIASQARGVEKGQLVMGLAPIGWRDYVALVAEMVKPIRFVNSCIIHTTCCSDTRPAFSTIPGLSPTLFLGSLGMGGCTAWFGLTDILNLQKGQSIIVNGAAG